MGENLTAGILKSIEIKTELAIKINLDLLTAVKTTNNILSKEIGKELKTQTKLLGQILKGIVSKEKTSKTYGIVNKTQIIPQFIIFGGKDTKQIISDKKSLENLKKFAVGLGDLAKSIELFAKALNLLEPNKLTAFGNFMVNYMLSTGKKILLFAFFTAIAAPLLYIGLAVTLPALWLWMGFYIYAGLMAKSVYKGIKTVNKMFLNVLLVVGSIYLSILIIEKVGGISHFFMAIAIVILAMFVVAGFYWLLSKIDKPIKDGGRTMLMLAITTGIVLLIIVLAAYILGNPQELIKSTLFVIGVLIGLALVYLLISLAENQIKGAGRTMLMLAFTTLLVIGVIILAAMFGGGPESLFLTSLIVVGVLLGLGIVYMIIGVLEKFIKKGVMVMLLGAIVLILISVSMMIWKNAQIEWEDIGMVLALVTGLGIVFGLAGLAALFIAAGAGAMILVGVALVLISSSLKTFKETQWSADDTVNLTATLTDIVNVFVDLFSNLSFSDMLKILSGTVLLGSIGMSLGSLAQGLQAFASGYTPIYGVNEKGEVIVTGTKPFDADLGQRVGETIKALITPLIGGEDGKSGILAQLGAEADSWWGESDVSRGIRLVGDIGNAIGSLAAGLSEFGKGYIVTEWEIDEKGVARAKTTAPLDETFATNVANTMRTLVGTLIGIDGQPNIFAELGKSEDSWWGDSDTAKGIKLVGDIGNAIGSMAEGLINMADLKIPIYKYDEKSKKMIIVDYKQWTSKHSKAVGDNILTLVSSLTNPLKKIGEMEDDIEDGIEILEDLMEPLTSFIDNAKKVAEMDATNLKSNMDAIFNPLKTVFGKGGLTTIQTSNTSSVLGKYATLLAQVPKITNAEPVGIMFEKIGKSVTDMPLDKLKQLNGIMGNLRKFAEEMKGNFDDLAEVLEKLATVMADMDGAKIAVEQQAASSGVSGKVDNAASLVNSSINNSSTTSEKGTKMDVTELVNKLQAIHDTLKGGIEVEAKGGSFLSR
jgi:hypothetical protein